MTETVSIGPVEKATQVVGVRDKPVTMLTGDTLTITITDDSVFRLTYDSIRGYLMEYLK